jgi:CMP-N-acetylneuraminic acid synthetase
LATRHRLKSGTTYFLVGRSRRGQDARNHSRHYPGPGWIETAAGEKSPSAGGPSAALADDRAPTITALQHALRIVHETGWHPEHIALFQATCPLRRSADVERAIHDYLDRGADSALSVNELHLKAGRLSSEGWYQPQYQVGIRKQDLPPLYQENGALYLTRADLIAAGTLLGERTMLLHLPREAGIASIDDQFDFQLTEALYHQLGYEAEFRRLERRAA